MNNKIKIYLAGKMAGISFEESNTWRRDFSNKLWSLNGIASSDYIVINPNTYYNFKQPTHKSEREVMQYDLNHVCSSDIIVVNLKGVNTSIGTAMELFAALQKNIPVIAFGSKEEWGNTHPWIKECVSRVEETIGSVCDYIKDYYFIQSGR